MITAEQQKQIELKNISNILIDKYKKSKIITTIFGIRIDEIIEREALLGAIVLAHEQYEDACKRNIQYINMRNLFDNMQC